LQQAFLNNELSFKGAITELSEPKKFAELMALLTHKSWNVYAKEPFNGAEGGLEYLARYVSKTAISNERILSCDNNQVSFKWRDYSDQNKSKKMTLDAHEFIRRYLSHVLPDGFMRVRTFGFLANACKSENLNLIRSLLNSSAYHKVCAVDKESAVELIKRITGIDVELCKRCKTGHLKIIELFSGSMQPPIYLDPS
jgi:hypothetical protein